MRFERWFGLKMRRMWFGFRNNAVGLPPLLKYLKNEIIPLFNLEVRTQFQ